MERLYAERRRPAGDIFSPALCVAASDQAPSHGAMDKPGLPREFGTLSFCLPIPGKNFPAADSRITFCAY